MLANRISASIIRFESFASKNDVFLHKIILALKCHGRNPFVRIVFVMLAIVSVRRDLSLTLASHYAPRFHGANFNYFSLNSGEDSQFVKL